MIIAITGAICFGILLALNWMIGRSIVYPGLVLAGIWTLEFIAQIFAVGSLYPISGYAFAVFLIGGICFTGGAALGHVGFHQPSVSPVQLGEYRSDWIVLWILGVLLIVGIPYYLQEISQFTSAGLFTPTYFLQVRAGLLDQAASLSRAPLMDNLVFLSSIAALIAYTVTDAARRWRLLVWGLIALAIFYNLLTAAKTGAVTLVVALFGIHVLLRRRVPVRFLLLSCAGVLLLFGVVTVGRVESLGRQLTWQQSIQVTWEKFLTYFTASPVGFGIYLNHPDWVPAVWSPWRFFERTANYFGHYFHVPNANAQYVHVGPTLAFNTYTAFFSYYPAYGISGVVGFMFGLGWISSWIYRLASKGYLVWLVVYGVVFNGVIKSVFNEGLMLSLNFTIKLALIALLFEGTRRIWPLNQSVAPAGSMRYSAMGG